MNIPDLLLGLSELVFSILLFIVPFVILVFLVFKKFYYSLIVFLPSIFGICSILFFLFFKKLGFELNFLEPEYLKQYKSPIMMFEVALIFSLFLFPVAFFFDIRKRKKLRQNMQSKD